MADFTMPNLGADMEAATLMKWFVKPGDAVKRGDVIAEVETDKGLIEIECFETGVLEKLVAQPGGKLPVGGVMAVIRSSVTGGAATVAGVPATTDKADAKVPTHASPLALKIAADLGVDLSQLSGTGPGGLIDREDVEHAANALKIEPQVSQQASQTPSSAKGSLARMRASPLARRLANELGIDLSTLQGSGPDGAIERIDVEQAAAAKWATKSGPTKASASTSKGSDGMRRAIAAAMAKSNREIPHYYLQARIEMSRALSWLEAANNQRPITERLLPAVLLLKAVAKALRDVPGFNGFWIDNEHRIADAIHLGFAISMKGGGLVAPAIHEVDKQSCEQLMATLVDLIPRARSGRLRSSEMTDATLTVTSLGDLGVESVFGVIYPPQVALIGFGTIIPQPWAENGLIGVRPVMTVSLAADHRATDGHLGAQFLDAINRHLQAPETL
jgi:pyruvate dehydrogenase E2 component (dihydrolipoamide acetyltransferase)